MTELQTKLATVERKTRGLLNDLTGCREVPDWLSPRLVELTFALKDLRYLAGGAYGALETEMSAEARLRLRIVLAAGSNSLRALNMMSMLSDAGSQDVRSEMFSQNNRLTAFDREELGIYTPVYLDGWAYMEAAEKCLTDLDIFIANAK